VVSEVAGGRWCEVAGPGCAVQGLDEGVGRLGVDVGVEKG
jgi:hypothetical protein